MGNETQKAGRTSPGGSEMHAQGQPPGGQTLGVMDGWKQEDAESTLLWGHSWHYGQPGGVCPSREL